MGTKKKPAKESAPPAAPVVADDQQEFRLITIGITNLRTIQSLDYRMPESGAIVIGGRNRAGKTTFCDAIRMGLMRAAKGNREAIREGEDLARIKLDFGEFTIDKKIEPDAGDELRLKYHGESVERAREFLDGIIGEMSMDPVRWIEMSAAEKVDTMLRAIGLKDELDRIDMRYRTIEKTREDEYGKLRDAEAALRQYEHIPHDAPTVDLPMADALKAERSRLDGVQREHEAAKTLRAQCERTIADREKDIRTADDAIKEREAQIERLRNEIGMKRAEIAAFQSQRDAAKNALAKAEHDMTAHPPADYAALDAEVARINAHNETARKARERSEAKAKWQALHDARERMTGDLKALLQEKRQLCASAKFPVSELEFDGEVMKYQGFPVSEMSKGQAIRFATELAMALNPSLRIIRIERGSELDAQHLKIIDDLARERRYQVLIERVFDSPEDALKAGAHIVIEEGKIVSGAKA